MKAIVYRGPRQMALETIEKPSPGPGEVLIQVKAVGICGSELEGFLGHSSIRIPPLVMGHEFSGIVSETGEQVTGWSAGEQVVVNPLIACGTCDRCASGRNNICRSRQIIGIHRPGAFTEFVAVPQQNVRRLPEGTDLCLASLAEPLAVCLHALKLGLDPFEPLLIYGAGPIGLLSLQTALRMGTSRVMVVDRLPARLSFARRLGALTALPEEAEETYRRTFSVRGIDTVVDCVGVQATREQAFRLLNPGGRLIMVGLGQECSTLNFNHLVRQEISILGSYTYSDSDFQQAVDLLAGGQIRMENWAGVQPLADGPEAFRVLSAGLSPTSKIILQP